MAQPTSTLSGTHDKMCLYMHYSTVLAFQNPEATLNETYDEDEDGLEEKEEEEDGLEEEEEEEEEDDQDDPVR